MTFYRDDVADYFESLTEEQQEQVTACCMGSAVYGPSRCTCWAVEYDRPQQSATGMSGAEIDKCCNDCAYRAGSPERSGSPAYDHSVEIEGDLPRMPTGSLFFCHKGMRKAVSAVHEPSGLRVVLDRGDSYDATNHDGVPILANGDFAPLCAGFAATAGISTTEAHERLSRKPRQ